MLYWIHGAAILRHTTSAVSQIVYITSTLLEKGMIGGTHT